MSNQQTLADGHRKPKFQNTFLEKLQRNRGNIALIFGFLIILLYGLFFQQSKLSNSKKDSSNISELYSLLESETAESIHVSPAGKNMIIVKLEKKGITENEIGSLEFAIPNSDLPNISELARKHNVTYSTLKPNQIPSEDSLLSMVFRLISTLLPILLLLYLLRSSSLFNSGAKFNKLPKIESTTRFKDIAGNKAAKQDLAEIIEFLKSPDQFLKLGAKIPRGVLLEGPPGTGKTMIARATANEAGVPFYNVSGSDFVQMFVGVGASRVRSLFQSAKKQGAAIIFIDELDAIGRIRGNGSTTSGGNSEREQTLNALLVEMDGFNTNDRVIVLAATNRQEVLDPALLRPGRFDRNVKVTLPTAEERLEILKVHTINVRLGKDVDLSLIARFTIGFSGADLANLVNESCIFAARKAKDEVTQLEFEDGFNRAIEGVPGTLTLNDPLLRQNTAAHEAGHTAVAFLLRDRCLNEVHSSSIRPGSGYLGRMRLLPKTELAHVTRQVLIAEMAILYGGRAGEAISDKNHENLSAGSASDLSRMTEIAEKMVYEYGFGKRIAARVIRRNQSSDGNESTGRLGISEELKLKAESDIYDLITEAKKLCEDQLSAHEQFHKAITEKLIQSEEVRGSELLEMFNQTVAFDKKELA